GYVRAPVPWRHVAVPFAGLRVARRERGDLEPGVALKQPDEALPDRARRAEDRDFALSHARSLADSETDASDRDRHQPAAAFVDPAQQTKSRRGEGGEHLVVGQDAHAVHPHDPLAARAGIVLDRLIEELPLTADIERPEDHARELALARRRVVAALGVVALDEHHAVRGDMPAARSEER